jgi:hypothetical protein
MLTPSTSFVKVCGGTFCLGLRIAWVSSVISSIACGIALAVAAYSWRRMRVVSLGVMAWCAAAWVLSLHGFFKDSRGWHTADIPGFLLFGTLMTLPLTVFAIGWYRSPTFRGFLQAIPLPTLIGTQAYRLAGVVFLWMYAEGLMPPEIGIVTGCADAFIGITAIPLAWAVAKHIGGVRWLAIGWNLFGIADFLISVSMVSLSFIGVLALQPAPVRIGLHPLALISLFQLPLSIAIHLLALRRLMSPSWAAGKRAS